ncbi:hypothetical protein QBC37DRAFT_469608 [Rhypophila decipiens]|uniref:Serine/threonine-protein kinase MEC1 n=1 Tax=Rhypophila decipiens TaxID=261697 RepID=A0AAN7BCM4_9PEZI|nr:hypothetical protein QBC37DRAFT_469608 [Rhypophila decipiens]
MLDTFEIITTSGVVLWSRTFAAVSPSVVNNFITDVFIEEKSSVAAAKDGASAASNPPYKHEQHTLRWTFNKELGIIFVAVYRSLLHLSWIDKLVDNIKAIFVSLYGDQLKKPNNTILECPGFDAYFDQQYEELEKLGSKSDAKDLKSTRQDSEVGDEPPLPAVATPKSRAQVAGGKGEQLGESGTPNASRPSTPGSSHLVVAKAGPVAKMSRRARKAQANTSAPFSSGDEGPAKKSKQVKTAKRGRRWDADGLADEDDSDVQLDYSALNAATSESEAEPGSRPGAMEEVDASTWGSQTKGKFVLKDLGDEVHQILASEEAKKAAVKPGQSNSGGLVGSSLSAIGGLFRNVVGGKVLTKADLDKAMKGMVEHLLKKNVAQEAAIRLCEGVEKELIGVKTANFESINTRIQNAMEASLTKMLTPTSSLDLLREIDSITSPPVTSLRKARPYVMSIVGVNGVGKSTNLSKICFFLLQNKYKVLIAAGDTFRSGAVEQLAVHVRNLKELTAREGGKVELYQKGYGKDAATVAKDAVTFAAQEGFDVVLIDTAGRRHNDQRLMSSLEKFAKFAQPDKILMVGEALVGTDSVAQARNFNAAFGSGRSLDGFIISKCDTVGDMVGTLVSLVHATNVPVLFVGVGQHYSDLRNFSVKWAVEKLLSTISASGGLTAGPPPSTLAAQLVENISTTPNRSSRPDETSEMKRLFNAIERVKSDPKLLTTQEERIEHNHLLIYMSGIVVLDGLKWDDPFANKAHLRTQALNVLNFLTVTIKETPAVLELKTDGKSFIFRGQEPLWLWILPRLLKLLGNTRCTPIASAIHGLLCFVFELTANNGSLWNMGSLIMQYFQTNLTAVLDYLKTLDQSQPDQSVRLDLPPDTYRKAFALDIDSQPRRCTYTIRGRETLLRHATGLISIVHDAIINKTNVQVPLLFSHNLVWFLDCFLPIVSQLVVVVQPLDFDLTTTIRMALDLAVAQNNSDGVASVLSLKANANLVTVCCAMFGQPDSLLVDDDRGEALRRVICSALIQLAKGAIMHRPTSRLIVTRLITPALQLVSEEGAIIGPNTDIWRSVHLLSHVTASPLPVVLDEAFKPDKFDVLLRQEVSKLGVKYKNDSIDPRPRDHARIKIWRVLQHMAGLGPDSNMEDLEALLIAAFENTNEDNQCQIIETASYLFCTAEETLELKSNGSSLRFRCTLCSSQVLSPATEANDTQLKMIVFSFFSSLIKLPSFIESKRPRIFAMFALRRMARHSRRPGEAEYWDVEKPGPGQWCLQSLNSSVRELRIAAGRTIGVILADSATNPIDKEVLRKNRATALAVLRSLSDKGAPLLHESCIMAWGQVGRVAGDDELNLVLVKLVEYLGHRNVTVSAFAASEILNLAEARGVTTRRLFEPFWSSLAFSVIKDLVTSPQTTKTIAELLQISVPNLLRLLQKDALPWLVLTKKKDVVQKIAEARGETETWAPCLEPANLPAILALLLIQEAPDMAKYAMSTLRNISSHFDSFELVELLGTDPLKIALELFKAGSEADEARKSRVRSALANMATWLSTDAKDKRSKKGDIIGRYLQQYALGLAARLSETITDSLGQHPPIQEQKRCLGAMEEMIKTCKTYVSIARPQMSACLLDALASYELRPAAFSCWEAMLTQLGHDDITAQLETTFFVIGHYWTEFDEKTKQKARGLIETLFEKNAPILFDFANKLPSLKTISDLADVVARLEELRSPLDKRESFLLFSERLSHENPGVVERALTELLDYLSDNQDFLQASTISGQPDSVVTTLMRSLLDCSSKYNGWQPTISRLCADAIGLIGCLDSNRVETTREERQIVVAHNFEDANETSDFVAFLLENVLVKAFLSTVDTKFLGFLSYAMQELMERVDINDAVKHQGAGATARNFKRWNNMSESARNALAPFLDSRFAIGPMPHVAAKYPVFTPGRAYASWLRVFVLDLLRNGQNVFSQIVFEPLCRLIKVKELAVAEFLLPYVTLHVVVGHEQSSEFRDKVAGELNAILQYQPPESASYGEREQTKLLYEAVFRIIDYFLRWIQTRKSKPGSSSRDQRELKWAQEVLDSLDTELISRRAFDCKEYARALFFLEPHIKGSEESDGMLQALQDIYTEIDDPDGLEGISAHLKQVDLNQQALNHRKAGRWTAAQTWYEIRHSEAPDDADIQIDLLTCLKESGQHDVLLNYAEGMKRNTNTVNRIIPFAAEASWATSRWETLEKYISLYSAGDVSEVFNLGIAQALLYLKAGNAASFNDQIKLMRDKVAARMSYSTTASLRTAHEVMLQSHVLTDLELLARGDPDKIRPTLERRLEVLGAYVSDKQYLLGVRRAAMELLKPKFENEDISASWLSTARLARKSGSMHQSFNAVLHAQQLGDGSAIIENARLLYRDGHHRKAIQVLQLAIDTNSFIKDQVSSDIHPPTSSKNPETQKSLLTARALLLLAKWLDSTGQTHASALRSKYQQAARTYSQWEKGHYYLGRHYKKILESEKTLKLDDQSDEYLSGETAKLVVENYLRSLNFGTKYLYQTLPRILTLWLELGAQVDKPPEGKVSLSRELHMRRKAILHELHKHIIKNLPRLPAYIFYTVLSQIVARIAHPSPEVFKILEQMILKVVEAYPRQSLWSLFSLMTQRQGSERRQRGLHILEAIRGMGKKIEGASFDMKQLLRMGEKLAEQLLLVCNNGDFQSNRTTTASITRDLNFNHKCTPCPLVMPVETCLTATLPTLTDNLRKHKAFARDVITIDSFSDHVLVLSSLAKPRKLTARGSDGKQYGLLIKPKDDLRTDQRLMEFNGMINRSLKRDAESSKRQLYIKTYAVTPLNEECGIIEWVDGLKTLRDILLSLYKARGIAPNYAHIAELMKEAIVGETNIHRFTGTVLGMFPPVLAEWFINQFPNPSMWFAARLKYTRSCAVMSMVGTILGLGDRHGENVLLEEGNGGVFHVDFNCLFDKGLTFAQPERVPFRLTHNMTAAMGIYGYEGPFRHCSELTLRILRQQEETLMTILEAFIYDPTLDLQKKKRNYHESVKLNPTSVVESIKRKVRGLLPDESIPLGVEGQVEELIKQAVNPRNLSAMYIGWCPFL